ncbi:response regulator [uncultured Flavonifractor sp.]|uniref:response regulator n=1 Tax=uncultured Flavonifractor sp. TaxID=1193534 RepID=UPI002628758D|nr:response regulator [uncultured Flavonifractor sp.]
MRKLLVIDDNLDFLGFLASALEKYFEVYTATGVKDALRLLEHQKVEAICSDYNMQDGTGLDLLEEIRQKGITVPFLLIRYNKFRKLKRR